jgi:1-deoxy-D-xylulose-5-phosphate synthase
MPTGSSLNLMMKAFPKRAFDVDIAEQHALTFAAGLATQGMKPFCVIYSTFLQRAYDQLIHDVALQQLPVVLCVDRAGLVGDDGATHHGAFDLAFLRCIPNVILAAPMDEIELRNLMFTAAKTEKEPFVIRYPRGKALHANWKQSFETIEIGSGRQLRKGRNIAVVSIGHPGNFVVEALNRLEEKGVFVAHYDLRFLKPLDEQLLKEVFQLHTTIVTVEDGVITGGMGSALMEWVQEQGYSNKIVRLGIPDQFIAHGSTALLQAHCGYDAQSIYDIILSITVDL